jgi:hypothetical protein
MFQIEHPDDYLDRIASERSRIEGGTSSSEPPRIGSSAWVSSEQLRYRATRAHAEPGRGRAGGDRTMDRTDVERWIQDYRQAGPPTTLTAALFTEDAAYCRTRGLERTLLARWATIVEKWRARRFQDRWRFDHVLRSTDTAVIEG